MAINFEAAIASLTATLNKVTDAADTDFTLTATIYGLTNYKNMDKCISCRVYQQII